MAYINTKTLEYPVFEIDIRLANKNVSFPRDFVPPSPFAVVNETNIPAVKFWQNVTETTPELVGDKWVQKFVLSDKYSTQAEIDAAIADKKQELKKQLATIRFKKETGGYDFNGSTFDSDDRAQLKVMQTISAMQQGAISTIDWKTRNGWINVGLAELSTIYSAGLVFVSMLFATEKTISETIDSCTTFEELDAINLNDGWPV